MQFLCPFCNFTISVADAARGTRTVCDSCRKQVLVPAGEFDEGCVIGDFAILNKLGEGSIGTVYKAFQISLKRVVALKILSKKYSKTEKGRQEFLDEARTAAKLNHNNLVQSYAVGEIGDICYMAMTYIHGESLKSRIRREGAIPCDEALHIVQQMAEALHYAWTESRLIHRDIKPDNIMLADNGVVKLTDLGLAINQAEWREDMDISGSPSYMSPEQFAGEKLDTRSDIYSLGVTLYQMLTGELPYDAETLKSIARQHFEDKVPDVGRKAQVPARVNALVKKMMAKVPEKRFANMDVLLREIWEIRQQTAPNQAYVPDVHTISMRRLDYEMQNLAAQSMAAAEEKRKKEHAAAVRSSAIFAWVMVVLLALVLISVLCMTVFMRKHDRISAEERHFRALENDVAMFEILSADTTLPAGELELEADRIMERLGEQSVRERAMQSHILQMIKSRQSQIEAARVAARIEAQNLEIDGLTLEKKNLLTENAELKQKMAEIQALLAERDSLLKRIEELTADCGNKDAEITALREKHTAENENVISIVKGFYYAMIYECWEQRLFGNVPQILADGKHLFPCLERNFEKLEELNRTGENIHQAFQNGKTEYARQHFGSFTVSHLQNGTVYCFSADSKELTGIPWDQLTKDEAWAILSVKPELFPSETLTGAMFEVLQGKLGTAGMVAPDPFENYTVCLAKFYTGWELPGMALTDARKRYQKYRKMFTGSIAANEILDAVKDIYAPVPESTGTDNEQETDEKNAENVPQTASGS